MLTSIPRALLWLAVFGLVVLIAAMAITRTAGRASASLRSVA